MNHIISGKTTVVGLIGYPVSHSFSPRMHNAAARAAGVDLVYIPLPVAPERVREAVHGLRGLGLRGANVTIPHKQAVMPFLDVIDEAASVIGAVNTIVVEDDGVLRGTNTDWVGFADDLKGHGISAENRQSIILGAGGSARAIVYALIEQNADIHIYARRLSQAQELANAFKQSTHYPHVTPHLFTEIPDLPTQKPLIVNTTPLGMTPRVDNSAWPDDLPIPADATVYDLVYNPRKTKLMRDAIAVNCQAVNGMGMLLRQGATAFELWTGVMPDLSVMAKALASVQ